MHRLFVGLRPPAPVRQALLATMAGVPDARWQDDGQLHLTLRFIGEVERPVAEDVAAALEGLHLRAPELRIEGVGCFEHRGRANTLWAGVTPREPLAALHRKVDAATARAGLAPDRRAFVPHVTLARLNVATDVVQRWLCDHAMLASEPFTPDAVLLCESSLGRERATYEVAVRYPFTG